LNLDCWYDKLELQPLSFVVIRLMKIMPKKISPEMES
jgi:hypothetical protein